MIINFLPSTGRYYANMRNVCCFNCTNNSQIVLDVDPGRDDDTSPMSSYRCLLRPTWMTSDLWHKSNISQNLISNLKRKQVKQNTSRNSVPNFFEKNPIFMCPCCSTREDLSIDVSITNVGLILTKLWWFQLIVTSQNSNFELLKKKKIKFLSFNAAVLVKTFLLMHQLPM